MQHRTGEEFGAFLGERSRVRSRSLCGIEQPPKEGECWWRQEESVIRLGFAPSNDRKRTRRRRFLPSWRLCDFSESSPNSVTLSLYACLLLRVSLSLQGERIAMWPKQKPSEEEGGQKTGPISL